MAIPRDQSTSNAASAATNPPHEYWNEVMNRMADYEELSRLHDHGHHSECRERCLDLLREPHIPLWNRVQTHQMVATLLLPALAEDHLQIAGRILGLMDVNVWQTRLLKTENNKMSADLDAWREKNGLVGKDLDGMNYGDFGSQPVFCKLDPHQGSIADDGMESTLKAREVDLEAREAQLHQAQARRNRDEAQLLDEQIENDCRRKELRQSQAKNEQIKAQLQADKIEHDLRVRALQAADNLINEDHTQQASMLQSIRDLRAGLEGREPLYKNERVTLEGRIRGLQQEMDSLRVEVTDATSRYQQDKAATEAEIDELLVAIIEHV